MKNQQGRRNGNRDFDSYEGGREEDNRNANYGEGRRDQGYDNDQDSRGFGGGRGNNSGYENQNRNSMYASQGRRGENYGFGSQQNNDSYRNFSSQGRNSGLGNQGGNSSYGQANDWNRRDDDWGQSDMNRGNEWGRGYSGNEWNSGRSSYRPYREDEYQPGNASNNTSREENWRNSGDQNRNQGFGTSYQDSSRGQMGGERGNQSSEGRRDSQSHRGKGPKGYQRSDERIEENVNERLTDDHMLDASSIEVKVSKGEVTLTGTVSSKEDKRRAEEIVENVSGVSNVENRIRVNKEGDREKAEGAESRSRNESNAEKGKVKQTANGAHV